MFDGEVEADESYFVDNAKANVVAVLPVKSPYSVF